MKNNTQKGIYLALAASIISGFSIFVNKFAVDAIKPPLLFAATKNAGVGLLILAIVITAGRWRQLKALKKADCLYLLLIAVIGGSLPFYLFFTGLSQIPAVNGAIIQKTLVFWVGILALPFLREKITRSQFFAVLLLFTGNLFVGGFKGFKFSQGEFLVLLATILWGVETVLAKKVLVRVDPDLVIGARMGLGSIVLLTATAVTSPSAFNRGFNLNSTQWFWLLLTMVTLLSYVIIWYRALKFSPATTSTAVLVSSTLVTNTLSAIFITKSWNFLMTFQGVFILFGLFLILHVSKSSNFLSPRPSES